MWFVRHFLLHAPPVRPILLLMDDHSSHYQPSAIHRAAEEGIIMFVLPPHTSHLTQPLDKGCFGPLKMHWKKECWEFLVSHPGQVVTRYQFSAIFSRAWANSMTMSNVVAGFRTAGVYPVNRLAVEGKKGTACESLAEKTGLNFIPLYSPSHRRSQSMIAATAAPAVTFDPDEITLFQKRFEEGYDVQDERYETWLKMYHPGADQPIQCTLDASLSDSDTIPNTSSTVSSSNILLGSSVLSRVLTNKAPSLKYPDKGPRPMSGARVLKIYKTWLRKKGKRRKSLRKKRDEKKRE